MSILLPCGAVITQPGRLIEIREPLLRKPAVRKHSSVANFPELVKPLIEVERNAIESAMILCVGNITLAAARLGVSRITLHRKLQIYRAGDAARS